MADSKDSKATKIVAAAGGGGVLVGLVAAFETHSWIILAIVIAGILVVGALVLGYFLAMKVLDKKRAAAGDEAIEDDSRRRLQKVNDPEQVAKIAELGRQFEEGVKKYRQATGQRLSESPWYLFTGTPGSGKTEAIRHCGIQMPEGLHKEQQGAGGTVNMDWWFTEDGIILDTAGRFLTEVASSPEWERFLKLLNKARPDCPINGMLIALPADSLQKDTTEEVQQKATEISRFLDRARNTLGVRFPVFVVITKSDLIPGFREFFAHINDPELQAQIVGWSKPGGLDEAFEPDDVEEYLKTLRNTLLRRRINLISDPICENDPDGRRLNEVDSLYLFPDSLMEIAPRLKRYLQMVFVKSKFNQTPLFLRGIYFTSAFEEGAALDSTLARIRGVSLEELEAEGRTWKRERALFLRELFEKKVFKENGLVTRASNTHKLQRNRKLTLLGAGFAALIVLGCFTWFSYKTLAGNIGPESTFWAVARESGNYENLKLVDGTAYHGADPAKVGDLATVTPVDFFATMRPAPAFRPVSEEIPVPPMFRPLVHESKPTFNELRQTTFRLLYDRYVLVPLVKQTLDKLKADAPNSSPTYWGDKSTATLAVAELLKLECIGAGGAPSPGTLTPTAGTPTAGFQLQPLFKFLPSTSGVDPATVASLQKTLDTLYDNTGKPNFGDPATLAQRCFSNSPDAQDVLLKSVDACIARLQSQWFEPLRPAVEMVAYMRSLRGAFGEVDSPQIPKSQEEYDERASHLRAQFENIQKVKIPEASTVPGWQPGQPLAAVFQAHNDAQKAVAARTWKVLLDAIPDQSVAPLKPIVARLNAATTPPTELNEQFLKQMNDAKEVDGSVNNNIVVTAGTFTIPSGIRNTIAATVPVNEIPTDPNPSTFSAPAYVVMRAQFKDAIAVLPDLAPDLKDVKLDEWKDNFHKLEQELAASDKALPAAPGDMRTALIKLQLVSRNMIQPALKFVQIKQTIDQLADTNDKLKGRVLASGVAPPNAPELFLVPASSYKKEFTPDGAFQMLKDLNSMHEQIDVAPEPLQKATLLSDLSTRETAVRLYLADYKQYWSAEVDTAFCNPDVKSWGEFCKRLKDDAPNPGHINDKLNELRRTQQTALRMGPVAELKSLPLPVVKAVQDCAASADKAGKEIGILDPAVNPNTNQIFNNDCALTLSRWSDLCNLTVAQARNKIKALGPADFKRNFIASTGGVDGAEYWKNLYRLSLKLLADEFESSAADALRIYKKSYDGTFPLVQFDDQHPENVLRVDNATDALAALDVFLPAGPEDAQAKLGGDSTSEMDKQLDRLSQLHGLQQSDRDRLKEQQKILKVLVDPNARCTLTFISHTGTIGAELKKSVELHEEPIDQQYVTAVCDSTSDWIGYRIRAQDDKMSPLKFNLAGTTQLWFTFGPPNQPLPNKQVAVPRYDCSWVVFRLLQDEGGFCAPGTKGLTWYVEVPEAPAPNNKNRVLVRIEFTLSAGQEMPEHKWW